MPFCHFRTFNLVPGSRGRALCRCAEIQHHIYSFPGKVLSFSFLLTPNPTFLPLTSMEKDKLNKDLAVISGEGTREVFGRFVMS